MFTNYNYNFKTTHEFQTSIEFQPSGNMNDLRSRQEENARETPAQLEVPCGAADCHQTRRLSCTISQ